MLVAIIYIAFVASVWFGGFMLAHCYQIAHSGWRLYARWFNL